MEAPFGIFHVVATPRLTASNPSHRSAYTYGAARRQPLVIFIRDARIRRVRSQPHKAAYKRPPRLILQRTETRNPE